MQFVSNAVHTGSVTEPIEGNGIAFYQLSIAAGSGSDSDFPLILYHLFSSIFKVASLLPS